MVRIDVSVPAHFTAMYQRTSLQRNLKSDGDQQDFTTTLAHSPQLDYIDHRREQTS